MKSSLHRGTTLNPKITRAEQDARFPRRRAQVVNVDEYIPAGTDTTAVDCSSYFNAAFTAAGANGMVQFSGRYRCDHELTILNFQTLEGINPVLGSGGMPNNTLDFRNIVANASAANQKVGIRYAASAILRNFLAYGPGDQTALAWGAAPADGSTTSPRIENVSFYNWQTGLRLYNAYYTQILGCVFQYCAVGIYADSCYNLHIFNPKFTCRSADGLRYGVGVQVIGLVRGINFHGGSIEDYSTGVLASSHSTIAMHGVYFETKAVGAYFLDLGDGNIGSAVELSGLSGYLLNHTAVVRMTHMANGSFVAHGNKYVYNQFDTAGPDIAAAPTVPFIYQLANASGFTTIDLFGDNVLDCYHSSNQTWGYTENNWTAGPIAGLNVRFPPTNWDFRSFYDLRGRPAVYPFKVVTAAATLAIADDRVLVNSASAITVKLSAVSGQIPGRTHRFTNIGAGTVTIAPNEGTGVSITGSASLASGQSAEYLLYSGNWFFV